VVGRHWEIPVPDEPLSGSRQLIDTHFVS
jgi:hypothetical protein